MTSNIQYFLVQLKCWRENHKAWQWLCRKTSLVLSWRLEFNVLDRGIVSGVAVRFFLTSDRRLVAGLRSLQRTWEPRRLWRRPGGRETPSEELVHRSEDGKKKKPKSLVESEKAQKLIVFSSLSGWVLMGINTFSCGVEWLNVRSVLNLFVSFC